MRHDETKRGDFYLAKTGDSDLATSGDFLMATDIGCDPFGVNGAQLVALVRKAAPEVRICPGETLAVGHGSYSVGYSPCRTYPDHKRTHCATRVLLYCVAVRLP